MTNAGRERVKAYGPTIGVIAVFTSILAFGVPIVRSAGSLENSVAINARQIDGNNEKIESLRATTTDLLVATSRLLEITQGTQQNTVELKAELKADISELRDRVRALESKK